jgi:murein tripeptide amidase MpaA
MLEGTESLEEMMLRVCVAAREQQELDVVEHVLRALEVLAERQDPSAPIERDHRSGGSLDLTRLGRRSWMH